MGVLVQVARQLIAAMTSRTGLATIGGAAALDLPPFGGGGGPFGIFDGGSGPRRRRRRRALTASDKADIAFISGTLGKPAGRDFAMVVAARG